MLLLKQLVLNASITIKSSANEFVMSLNATITMMLLNATNYHKPTIINVISNS